eukprot:gnl/TRDRNA2_/TRDRNA2_203646_c0_seq1.p1 gnl/TRDRNA2_/TRDRNA2_203646_c0~~gnl/TRDRNA2_/TRDRNA2_203646_c0_seq1.p1  ORF type:complete len:113 (+),score=12.67 gnl/TRDRNA2_/TRDRNA2_203646_c0_seq1:61-399(+)
MGTIASKQIRWSQEPSGAEPSDRQDVTAAVRSWLSHNIECFAFLTARSPQKARAVNRKLMPWWHAWREPWFEQENKLKYISLQEASEAHFHHRKLLASLRQHKLAPQSPGRS